MKTESGDKIVISPNRRISHKGHTVFNQQKHSHSKQHSKIRHSVKFLHQGKGCLRECCKIKREIQIQLSKDKFRKGRLKTNNVNKHHISVDQIAARSNQKKKQDKQQRSFVHSRMKTLNSDEKRKQKVYILPHLKEFGSDVMDQDNESKHKVQHGRHSRMFGDNVETNQEVIRPLKVKLEPLNRDQEQEPYSSEVKKKEIMNYRNIFQRQDNSSYVQEGKNGRDDKSQSYIDRNEIYKIMDYHPKKRQRSEDQRTTPTRPYYKYLQNYPKSGKPQKISNQADTTPNLSLSRSQLQSNSHQKTIFHTNKLRVSTFKSHLKLSKREQTFIIPQNQQEVAQYLLKYTPIQPHFNVKALVKKDNFNIVRQPNFCYFGQLKDEKKHGKGVLLTKKQLFQGQFDKDLKVNGVQKTKQGTYTGPFLQGKRHGIGQFKWPDGQYFEGEWRNGKKQGHGVWKSAKGNLYEGQWKNNHQNGKGIYIHRGGSKYTGFFKDFLKHGRGQQQFANGDKYVGQYEEGKPHGYGTYTWMNGDSYKGDFVEGSRSGKGTLFQEDGTVYEGSFRDDQKEGSGKERYKNGDYFEGIFEGGQRKKGQLYSKKGELLEQIQGSMLDD